MTARMQVGASKPEPRIRDTEITTRLKRALWLILVMLSLSLLLVVLGVYATTRTESLNVTGYLSGVILTLGSFLGLLGLQLEENRKQLLRAAIIFLSFGIILSFLCLVIDSVYIVLNMDMRPLKAGRCQFYSSGSSYIYEQFYSSVSCWNLRESCNMTVRSGTCYCCDLYNCANGNYLSNYYEYVGIRSCEEIFTLHILIWVLSGLNLTALFTGILTTAVLGSIKDLRSSSLVNESTGNTVSSPTAPPLTDTNIYNVQQGLPIFFPSSEGTLVSHGCSSTLNSNVQSQPRAFMPPRLLPHKM